MSVKKDERSQVFCKKPFALHLYELNELIFSSLLVPGQPSPRSVSRLACSCQHQQMAHGPWFSLWISQTTLLQPTLNAIFDLRLIAVPHPLGFPLKVFLLHPGCDDSLRSTSTKPRLCPLYPPLTSPLFPCSLSSWESWQPREDPPTHPLGP